VIGKFLTLTASSILLQLIVDDALKTQSGWIPMQRNLRKRNLRQPIKSSLLPYARFESGSRDDLIG